MGRLQLTLFQRLVLLAAAGAILLVLISQINYHGLEELPTTWAIQVLIVAGLVVLAMWPKSPEEGTGILTAVQELRARFDARKRTSALSGECLDLQNVKKGYLARHWRGELSLPVSYWVNGVLLGILLAVLLRLLTGWLPSTAVPLTALAWLSLLMAAAFVVISVWGQVGIWRSAGLHAGRGGDGAWAVAARVIVIFGSLAALGEANSTLWPQMKDMGPLAFGRDPLGPPARVSISPDGQRIILQGAVASGTSRRFAETLANAPNVKIVTLSSPGGRLLEAQRIADVVRERRLDTHAVKECSSACILILVSGVKRTAMAGSQIGLHQASLPGIPPSEVAAIETQSRKVYERAGIASDFIDRALSTPNHSPWYPSADELYHARVLTDPVALPAQPAPNRPQGPLAKGAPLRQSADFLITDDLLMNKPSFEQLENRPAKTSLCLHQKLSIANASKRTVLLVDTPDGSDNDYQLGIVRPSEIFTYQPAETGRFFISDANDGKSMFLFNVSNCKKRSSDAWIGTYGGKFAGWTGDVDGEVAIKSIGERLTVSISMASAACGGDMKFEASVPSGDTIVHSEDTGPSGRCQMALTRRGNRLDLTEKSCFYFHGGQCSFDGHAVRK